MAIIPECDDGCVLSIDRVEFEALYDLLDTKVREGLQVDFDCKKINGATYAEKRAAMMDSATAGILSAMVSLAQKETAADRLVKYATATKIDYETTSVLPAQVALTERQIAGFDDNLRQKLFETQMNSWAMMFSSGLLEDKPVIISNDEATNLYQDTLDALGTGGTTNPLGTWTQEVSATDPASGSTTVSWGAVTGATVYTIYASSTKGGLTTFPKTVLAGGNEVITIPVPAAGESERYSFTVIAVDASGAYSRQTTTSILIYGP